MIPHSDREESDSDSSMVTVRDTKGRAIAYVQRPQRMTRMRISSSIEESGAAIGGGPSNMSRGIAIVAALLAIIGTLYYFTSGDAAVNPAAVTTATRTSGGAGVPTPMPTSRAPPPSASIEVVAGRAPAAVAASLPIVVWPTGIDGGTPSVCVTRTTPPDAAENKAWRPWPPGWADIVQQLADAEHDAEHPDGGLAEAAALLGPRYVAAIRDLDDAVRESAPDDGQPRDPGTVLRDVKDGDRWSCDHIGDFLAALHVAAGGASGDQPGADVNAEAIVHGALDLCWEALGANGPLLAYNLHTRLVSADLDLLAGYGAPQVEAWVFDRVPDGFAHAVGMFAVKQTAVYNGDLGPDAPPEEAPAAAGVVDAAAATPGAGGAHVAAVMNGAVREAVADMQAAGWKKLPPLKVAAGGPAARDDAFTAEVWPVVIPQRTFLD